MRWTISAVIPPRPPIQGAERAAESLRREEIRRNEQAQKNVHTMRGKWATWRCGSKKNR